MVRHFHRLNHRPNPNRKRDALLTLIYCLFCAAFIFLWMTALNPTTPARTRLLNLFGATTISLFVGLVVAAGHDDKLLRGIVLIGGIVWLAMWASHLKVFTPTHLQPVEPMPYGNEQYQQEYDKPQRHLSVL